MAFAGTRLLKIKIGATDYTASISAFEITSDETDSDFVSFADAATGGGRLYKLTFTAAADYAVGTLWDQVYSNAGTTVAYSVSPYGATTFTAANPGFTGSAVIVEPSGTFIGTEADPSTTAVATFEVEWNCTGKPVRVVTGSF